MSPNDTGGGGSTEMYYLNGPQGIFFGRRKYKIPKNPDNMRRARTAVKLKSSAGNIKRLFENKAAMRSRKLQKIPEEDFHQKKIDLEFNFKSIKAFQSFFAKHSFDLLSLSRISSNNRYPSL